MQAPEILEQFCKQTDSDRLAEHWRLLELRKRFTASQIKIMSSSQLQEKYINLDLTMRKIWAELESRLDNLPEELLYLMINTGQTYTLGGII